MANVIRYFSTTSAGAADGTTWADRAALFVSSAYNTIITAFNFGGSDSLECRIGPGSYSVPTTIITGTFTVAAPTAANPLWLMACNSDGTDWAPPTPTWTSAQPMWDTTNMPILTTSSSAHNFLNCANVNLYGLDISASIASRTIVASASVNWCRITATASNSSAGAIESSVVPSNCVLRCTGTIFNYIVLAGNLVNCRLEGNASASSGNRRVLNTTSSNNINYSHCTFLNCVGGGLVNNGSGHLNIENCTFINCGTAIWWSSTGSVADFIRRCIFVGNTTGILTAGGSSLVYRCRLRNNTTNLNLHAHSKEMQNIVTAGTDADEFVDAASGDYRIKNTSSLWGLKLGPSDQPASGSGGGIMLPYGFDDI